MTISISTLICYSLVCFLFGAIIATVVVWNMQDSHYEQKFKDMEDIVNESIQQANNWRHWTNVYRRLLDESEKKNTIIINEQPKKEAENDTQN